MFGLKYIEQWEKLIEFLSELTDEYKEQNEFYKVNPDDGHEYSEFVGEINMLYKIVNKINEIKKESKHGQQN